MVLQPDPSSSLRRTSNVRGIRVMLDGIAGELDLRCLGALATKASDRAQCGIAVT